MRSENPWDIVPSRDFDGHGTFLAGVACGNRIEEKNFTGIAPLATICVVKCKEAKESLREYYRIDTDEKAYAEQDIMAGVAYIWQKSRELRMPFVLCIGMGSSMGGHNGGGILGAFLQQIGDNRGVAVVAACGNEANSGHHYRSELLEEGGSVDVELQVGSREGFTMELWSEVPRIFSVGIVSPTGEYSGRTVARIGEKKSVYFLLDDTTIDIEYRLMAYEGGDECIQVRFRTPSEGVWLIRVFNETNGAADFDIWLPITRFLSPQTFFLQPDPDVTLCDPSNNEGLISVTYYDAGDRSIVVESSRGFTRSGELKPDIAAPGVDVYGPLPTQGNRYIADESERNLMARYVNRSGSSAAAAITAGAAALLLEWGIVRQNDVTMDSVVVKKYMIRGADASGLSVPNKLWGNGTLDVYDIFERLRGR